MEQMSVNSIKTNGAYKISFGKIMRAVSAEIRVHKKLAIISFVLYGVAMLLFMFNSTEIIYWGEHPESYPAQFVSSGWGAFFAVVGILVGFFTALNVFRDMNNQQICDVSMALPIKSSERFFSKLITLFFLQTAPLTVSLLGGSALSILFTVIRHPAGMEDDTAKLLFMLYFGALASSMFIMSVTVLCTCCCGALAESSYFSIILGGIINLLPVCFVNLVMTSAGFDNGLFTFLFYNDGGIDLGWWGFLFFTRIDFDDMTLHCVVGTLISLAVMLLSGLIYVKRDARTVGTPIASKVFFEVMLVLGCVTIFSLFAMGSYAMWGVLIAGVAYTIINIIVSRAKINALSFLKWAGKFAVTLAAFTVVLVVTIKTGGFGLINSRPATKYLEGAEFSVAYRQEITDRDGSTYYGYTRLETSALAPDKADEALEIIKKHFVKGRAEVNVFNVIFGSYNYDKVNGIDVTIGSDTKFGFRPSPKSQFREQSEYIKSLDRTVISYTLRYNQSLIISISEADAMIDELKALGCFYDEKDRSYYDDRVYASNYDGRISGADGPETVVVGTPVYYD